MSKSENNNVILLVGAGAVLYLISRNKDAVSGFFGSSGGIGYSPAGDSFATPNDSSSSDGSDSGNVFNIFFPDVTGLATPEQQTTTKKDYVSSSDPSIGIDLFQRPASASDPNRFALRSSDVNRNFNDPFVQRVTPVYDTFTQTTTSMSNAIAMNNRFGSDPASLDIKQANMTKKQINTANSNVIPNVSTAPNLSGRSVNFYR